MDEETGKLDPTSRTTEALLREIASLKELVFVKIDAVEKAVIASHEDLVRVPTDVQLQVGNLKELHEAKFKKVENECDEQFGAVDQKSSLNRTIIETRLDGMDKAIRLLQDTADKFPARIDEKILSLREIHSEKFESIQKQFAERDVRTEQTAKDTKTAVDAALAAQEKAVGKQTENFAIATQKSEQGFTKQIDQLGDLFRTATKGLEDKITDLKDRFNRGEGKGEGKVAAAATQQTSNSYLVAVIGLIFAVLLSAAGIVVSLVR